MHIEDLTSEIEAVFKNSTIEQVQAHIKYLEWHIITLENNYKRSLEQLSRKRKWAKWELKRMQSDLAKNPSLIARNKLVIRAIREGIAYRTA